MGTEMSTGVCTTRHETVRCNGCRTKPIIGVRYKCTACYDFDLCGECARGKGHQHPLEQISRYPREFPGFSSKTVHKKVWCDICKKSPIVGLRFKCKICLNFDICEWCHWDRRHNLHPLEAINVFPWKPIFNPSTSTVHVKVNCDICHTKPIVGIRYKCKTCDNFDICEACHGKNHHVHHDLYAIVTYPWQEPQLPQETSSRDTRHDEDSDANQDEEEKEFVQQLNTALALSKRDGAQNTNIGRHDADQDEFVEQLNLALALSLADGKSQPNTVSTEQGKPKKGAKTQDTDECTICYDKQIDSVFLPCGHMCACFSCAKEYHDTALPNARCPICRTPSQAVVRTYKS